MAKKLLAGLVLGGAAFAAYHALDLEQREALKDSVRDHCNALKDRAIDYAFYAADALDDFKEDLNDKLAAKADAADETFDFDDSDAEETPADDDIVLSSDEVADMTTAAEAPISSEASEATDEENSTEDAPTDQPEA